MTVHFIGAGPGAADLLTLRARDLIASCPLCLYAGSLYQRLFWHIVRQTRGWSTPLCWIWMILFPNANRRASTVWMWRACILEIYLFGQLWGNSFVVCGLKILL